MLNEKDFQRENILYVLAFCQVKYINLELRSTQRLKLGLLNYSGFFKFNSFVYICVCVSCIMD